MPYHTIPYHFSSARHATLPCLSRKKMRTPQNSPLPSASPQACLDQSLRAGCRAELLLVPRAGVEQCIGCVHAAYSCIVHFACSRARRDPAHSRVSRRHPVARQPRYARLIPASIADRRISNGLLQLRDRGEPRCPRARIAHENNFYSIAELRCIAVCVLQACLLRPSRPAPAAAGASAMIGRGRMSQ
jgi:hypothetical protein